jgi:RNase P subunit RPR2
MTRSETPVYRIVESGDYLHVVCVKCGEACEFDYKGLDPVMPLIEITCPRCGSSGEWKLHKAGFGFYELTKNQPKDLKVPFQ